MEGHKRGKMSRIERSAHVPKDQLWFHHPDMRRRVDVVESEFRDRCAEQTRTIREAQLLLNLLKKRGR